MALLFDLRRMVSFIALLVGFFLTAAFAAPIVECYIRLHEVAIPGAFFDITDLRHLVIISGLVAGMCWVTFYVVPKGKKLKLNNWLINIIAGTIVVFAHYTGAEYWVAPGHFSYQIYWDGFWGIVAMAGFCASVAVAIAELGREKTYPRIEHGGDYIFYSMPFLLVNMYLSFLFHWVQSWEIVSLLMVVGLVSQIGTTVILSTAIQSWLEEGTRPFKKSAEKRLFKICLVFVAISTTLLFYTVVGWLSLISLASLGYFLEKPKTSRSVLP